MPHLTPKGVVTLDRCRHVGPAGMLMALEERQARSGSTTAERTLTDSDRHHSVLW
jgi:hypothetical protein